MTTVSSSLQVLWDWFWGYPILVLASAAFLLLIAFRFSFLQKARQRRPVRLPLDLNVEEFQPLPGETVGEAMSRLASFSNIGGGRAGDGYVPRGGKNGSNHT
jgi:hypothetical protein